jgi:putative methyltransferase (TIGR04325 family)
MESCPSVATYPDYETALKRCGEAYADRELATVTLAKTRWIVDGDLKAALYPPNADATLTALRLTPGREPRVLDFGGSFGPHYFLAKQCLPKRYRWAVVETDLVASLGAELANDELRFFTSIDAARDWLGAVDLVHASGSLQCTPQPKAFLSSLIDLRAPIVAITRTAIALGRERVTTQTFWLSGCDPVHGLPEGVKDRELTFPRVFMAEQDFIAALNPLYRAVVHSLDDREGPLTADGVNLCLGENFVFRRRDH